MAWRGGWQVGCAADLGGRPSHCLPPGTSQAPRRARKRAEGGASSNVFSMFDQSQIQEFKEVGPCALWATGSVSAMHGKHPRGWQGPGHPWSLGAMMTSLSLEFPTLCL